MLSAFSAYIQGIAVFLVFSSLVLLLAPSEKSKAYIRLTLGFVLVLLVVKPMGGILDKIGSFRLLLNPINSITVPAFNSSAHNDIILSAYEEELQSYLVNLVDRDRKYTLLSAEFILAQEAEQFGMVESIRMTLAVQADSAASQPFIRIEPIRIQSGPLAAEQTEPEDPALSALKNTVSGFYNVPAQHIHCIVQVSQRERSENE